MGSNISISAIETALQGAPLLRPKGLPYPLKASGKVRDIYELPDAYLMIASDRLSAFDVILPTGIAGKGIILTQISLYWFSETSGLIPNHLVENHTTALKEVLVGHEELIPRSMLVKKLRPLPIEAVVRGYLSGSGWKSYLRTNALFGQPLPAGINESGKLPAPMFTPTTKAAVGDHDEPLTLEAGSAKLGRERFEEVADISMRLYALGSAKAREAGLILADTKFEFGVDLDDQLYLIDEALTPDSSRFWPTEHYTPGQAQTAFDKQYVRDYLETLDWDKTAPGPELPNEVVQKTQQLYLQALKQLVGNELSKSLQ